MINKTKLTVKQFVIKTIDILNNLNKHIERKHRNAPIEKIRSEIRYIISANLCGYYYPPYQMQSNDSSTNPGKGLSVVCYLKHGIGLDEYENIYSSFEDGFHIVFENTKRGLAYCFHKENNKWICRIHPIGMCPFSTYKIINSVWRERI